MGGTTTQNQNVTQTTSSIGPSQKPFYDIGMQKAAADLNRPFIPYGYTQDPATGRVVRAINPATGQPVANDRIAGFTQQQQNLQGEVAGMQTPGQFGSATNLANQAGVGALSAGNYDPSQFNAQQIQNQNLNTFQMDPAQQFGNEQAQQYMSPYVQNVLDVQKRKAQEDAQQSQLMQNLGAARTGTYGGSRQLLAGLTRERDLGRQMGDIQAAGMQSAYENAQNQFERDRTAAYNVNNANLGAKLGVQELGSKNNLQTALANQQYDLEAQKAAEQSRQFGSEMGLKGYQTAGDMAQKLANIGSAQSQADQARLALQQQTAAQQQELDQKHLTMNYDDYLEQREDPYKQLQRYMNLMSGVPQATQTTTTQSAPSPSLASQIMGTGLSAASIYNTANRAGVI